MKESNARMHAHTHMHTERQAVRMQFGSFLPFNRLEKAEFEGQLYILQVFSWRRTLETEEKNESSLTLSRKDYFKS